MFLDRRQGLPELRALDWVYLNAVDQFLRSK